MGGRAALRDGHGRSLVDRGGGSVVGSYGTYSYQDKSDLAGAGSMLEGVWCVSFSCRRCSLLVASLCCACVGVFTLNIYVSTYDFKFQI